jgi:hypothetical protein
MWLGCLFLCCCHQCLVMVVAEMSLQRDSILRKSDNSVNLACLVIKIQVNFEPPSQYFSRRESVLAFP